jgi:hypothetical protein
VPLTHEEITRVRRYRKWFLMKSEKAGVHGADSTLSVKGLGAAQRK